MVAQHYRKMVLLALLLPVKLKPLAFTLSAVVLPGFGKP